MDKKVKKVLLWFLDIGVNIAIIFLLVLVIQKWLIAPFDVSGASMCDTLNNINGECVRGYGEKIIINEATYIFNDPKRGDIIVFSSNDDVEKYYIKRIIGLPGETVEIKDGEVYVTGQNSKESVKLEEEYLNQYNKGNTNIESATPFSVFEVPENSYFVMGDNRVSSTDSRSCFVDSTNKSCDDINKAFVSRDQIRGKAWIVWWPIKNIEVIGNAVYNID
jgi:signal peptidase I